MIETVAVTASTNADMVERARQGAPEGLWLRAERQTGGRGRLGRRWESPVGNLYASTLVRPCAGDPPPQTLAFVAGLAVVDSADAWLPKDEGRERVRLKWPNDVLLDGAKLSGMLLESTGDAVVVGIGVNIAVAPEVAGRDTAALIAAGALPGFDAAVFVETLAERFATQLAIWRGQGLAAVLERWSARAHGIGERLVVRPGGEPVEGSFAGLDPHGGLLLRRDDGTLLTVHAGDVELMRTGDDIVAKG